ncbi:hypothetical protein [Dactylosporangium sp. CA-092794]|uniref:hypothetical protein n=1 Tax=Dactylosporangium sp. CA-092794 TaxID=3239929 RepID=UPI003D8F5B72
MCGCGPASTTRSPGCRSSPAAALAPDLTAPGHGLTFKAADAERFLVASAS